jgi:hypothetical protein
MLHAHLLTNDIGKWTEANLCIKYIWLQKFLAWQRGANGIEWENLADHDQKVTYSGDQLDILAILFVIVKILYHGGTLQRTKSLVESAVLTSIMPLHHTLVQNEAAYFGCIHQVSLNQPSTLGSMQGSSKNCPRLYKNWLFRPPMVDISAKYH